MTIAAALPVSRHIEAQSIDASDYSAVMLKAICG